MWVIVAQSIDVCSTSPLKYSLREFYFLSADHKLVSITNDLLYSNFSPTIPLGADHCQTCYFIMVIIFWLPGLQTRPTRFSQLRWKISFTFCNFFLYYFCVDSIFSKPLYKIITDQKNKIALFSIFFSSDGDRQEKISTPNFLRQAFLDMLFYKQTNEKIGGKC